MKTAKIQGLGEAKAYLRENYKKGCNCPVCGQFVKRYKRKLNSGMARTLIAIYKHHKYHPVNVKDFLRSKKMQNNHDWTLLRYWGLIVEHENLDEKKKSSGVWSITTKGIHFVENRVRIASHVFIYNTKVEGFSLTDTNIVESLGKHFNYKELMRHDS